MQPFTELLTVDQRQTLEFFFVGLKDVSEPTVDREQLLYNASVLAHFAQVSTSAETELPVPAHLGNVFDHFVFGTTLARDPVMMEIAGAQCLLMTGFFERQMRRRHNIRWYVQLGSSFFRRAAQQERAERKAQMLDTIGVRFDYWRERHARLSRELDDRPGIRLGRPC